MDILLYWVLAPLLVLNGIIFFHELGHYLIAKAFGVPVGKFKIGLGPERKLFTAWDTEFCIGVVPLGGYIKIVDTEEEAIKELEEAERTFEEQEEPVLRSLDRLKVDLAEMRVSMARRAQKVVAAAGPAANFMLAAVLFMMMAIPGRPIFDNTMQIVAVRNGTTASAAGLEAGDTIVEINERGVGDWNEALVAIQKSDSPVSLVVLRNGERLRLSMDTANTERPSKYQRSDYGSRSGYLTYGIEPPLPTVVGYSNEKPVDTGEEKVNPELPDGSPLDFFSGPIAIWRDIGTSATRGWYWLLLMSAALSIGIGIFNLLPFYPLDGGRIFRSRPRKTTQPEPELDRSSAKGGLPAGALAILLILLWGLVSDIAGFFTAI